MHVAMSLNKKSKLWRIKISYFWMRNLWPEYFQECNPSRSKNDTGLSSDHKNPSLEFTLGRPDWLQNERNWTIFLVVFRYFVFAFSITASVCPCNGPWEPEFYATEVLKGSTRWRKSWRRFKKLGCSTYNSCLLVSQQACFFIFFDHLIS